MKAMCAATQSHRTQLYARIHLPFWVRNYLLKGDMLLLRTSAPLLLLLLAFLGQQVCPSSGERGRNREVPSSARAHRSGKKPGASGRGKFSIDEDKMQCSWVAKDVEDAVRLSVVCENSEARVKGGVTQMQCEYNAKAQRCPGYQSDPKGFWKQVTRAFKRLQGKVCSDSRALVKAGMCKRAPRDAHFKLDIRSSVVSAQSGGDETPQPTRSTSTSASTPTSNSTCTGGAKRKAEEQCGSSWASVCNFFFSMLQSDDC